MSGLGETPEQVLKQSLRLVRRQLSSATDDPVGVLTATEVSQLNRIVHATIIDHMRIYGVESVKLVNGRELHRCEIEDREDRYYLGNILISSREKTNSGFQYYILRTPVSKKIFDEFLLKVKKLVKGEERKGKSFEPNLEDITKAVEELRTKIEDEALKRAAEFLEESVAEMIGYIVRRDHEGYKKERCVLLDDDKSEGYAAIRKGARPLYDSELQVVVDNSKVRSQESYFLGQQIICSKLIERSAKEKKKRYLIFEERVSYPDFDRFTYKLRTLVKKKEVSRSEDDVASSRSKAEERAAAQDVPVFGFD